MALIQCPECGKEISDQAISCPNCGFPINKSSKLCPDCSSEVPSEATICPKCGFPFNNELHESELEPQKGSIKLNNKNIILAIIAVIAGIVCIVIGVRTLSSEDIKFYKGHMQECVELQADVDSYNGGFYRSISRDYDKLIDYDKKKITTLTVKGMSFIGVGVIFVLCGFLIFKGIFVIFKEDSNGVNQMS